MNGKILIVDDEDIVVRSCVRILSDADYDTDTATSGFEALQRIEESHVDVLILDIMMPKMDGLEVLQRVKESHPDIDVIMVTGLSEIATAVKSMKLGAFDYLPKPFDPKALKDVVERAFDKRHLLENNFDLDNELTSNYRFEGIVGISPQMQAVYRLIAKSAPTNSTVLIRGESGTGKELVARAIHYNSLRKDKAFVPIDCGSLSETLLESELFGHVKGSFTGAVANKKGMFEVADGGTLFLDEIGNISLSTQAKLLRVLQEREYKAVGDTRTRAANIRLIAATNKDLKAMVVEGTFREDLYYRLNIFPIELPPLSQRREDIRALAFHFLKLFTEELGKEIVEFSEDAMNALVNYHWPGNVRELENTIHRAVILTNEPVIRLGHLVTILETNQITDLNVPMTSDELKQFKKQVRENSVREIEKQFVIEALKRNDWNVTKSAEDTGMQRSNFQALMKKYDIRIRGTEQNAN